MEPPVFTISPKTETEKLNILKGSKEIYYDSETFILTFKPRFLQMLWNAAGIPQPPEEIKDLYNSFATGCFFRRFPCDQWSRSTAASYLRWTIFGIMVAWLLVRIAWTSSSWVS